MDEANTPPLEEFCDECGDPAEMHITEIDKAGQVSIRHLCFDHSMPGMLDEMKAKFQARRIQRGYGK